MRHLLVIWMSLLCVQICWGNFVDPTDLFNFDEMNVELSKPPERRNGQKPDESGDGKPDASESLPSSSTVEDREPASKTEDYGDKKPETSGPPQSSASKIGEYEGDKVVQEPVLRCKDETMTKAVFTLFQQFVMNFVRLSQGMIVDSSRPVEFCMRIKATQYDLSVLRKFGQGDDNAVHAAHEKLSNLFQSACDLPDFSPVMWLEKRLGLSTTNLSLIVVSLLILFFIVKALTSIRMTSSKVWFAMVAVFMISVSFTWMEMYQKKVADQERLLTDSFNARCPHYEKLNMWERFTNYLSSAVTFQEQNCREFYEAMFINPITQVSPLEAVAVAVVKTVVAPWRIIGEGIKDLIIALFKDLPAQYAWFLMTLMTIAVIGCLYIPLLAFGYTIRIPWLLSIEPTARPKAVRVRDVKMEKAIKPREEQGQGDGVQHYNAILSSASPEPQTPNQTSIYHTPSSQSQVISSQTRALQKCQEERKKKNNLSKGPRDTTAIHSPSSLPMDGKKQQEKGTNSVLRSELASNQEKASKDRKESMPEDMSFVNLQPSDWEESYTELLSSDFNTASEIQDLSDEDDEVKELSEEDNLNLAGKCDAKSFEKDLKELNIRDT